MCFHFPPLKALLGTLNIMHTSYAKIISLEEKQKFFPDDYIWCRYVDNK